MLSVPGVSSTRTLTELRAKESVKTNEDCRDGVCVHVCVCACACTTNAYMSTVCVFITRFQNNKRIGGMSGCQCSM